ncbi:MAG: hypothetical protein ABIG39_03530 [Candidatus Micrarchaeota archaeon]
MRPIVLGLLLSLFFVIGCNGSVDDGTDGGVTSVDSYLTEGDKSAVIGVFNKNLDAMKNCDIELHNALVTKESLEILHPTCSNMRNERKCYVGKAVSVLVRDDEAVMYFPPFNHKEGWPIFFAKEDGKWKIDYHKMAFGISMGGSGCDTGWSWRNQEIKDDFCSYFEGYVCPDTT